MTKFQIHDQQPSQQNKKKMIIRRKISSPTEHIVEWLFCKKKKLFIFELQMSNPSSRSKQEKKDKMKHFLWCNNNLKQKKPLFQFILASFLVVLYNSNIHVNKTNTYFQTTNNYIKIKKLTQTEYFLLPGRSFSLFFTFYTSTGFPCQKWCMSCHLF